MGLFFMQYPAAGGGGGGGVTTLNSLSGALTLVAGSGITITPSGSNITIASTGGSGITSLTGDVTGTGPGATATTISSGVVSNAKLATMAAHTFKGNNTGSTGAPLDLTATQLTAELNQFSSTLQGVVSASGGGTTNFLRADGTWAPAGAGSGANVNLSNLSAPTAFNVELLPGTSDNINIGSSSNTVNAVFLNQIQFFAGGVQNAYHAYDPGTDSYFMIVTGSILMQANPTVTPLNAGNITIQPGNDLVLVPPRRTVFGSLAQFQNNGADPTPTGGAQAGDVYFNTSLNKLKVFNGTAWETITSV